MSSGVRYEIRRRCWGIVPTRHVEALERFASHLRRHWPQPTLTRRVAAQMKYTWSMTSQVESGSTRSDRLDRLPFTREHTRLVVGSGLGWALDAMDVGLISFVMAALAVQWRLGTTTLSAIASIGFVGMAIGASLGGLLADRIGRRQVFAATLLVYGLATGAAALSWSVGALLVFRFVIGLGLGAELPVAATLVSEFAPARIRGRVVVALEAFWAVGWLLAALIGYFVVSAPDDGWRWALVSIFHWGFGDTGRKRTKVPVISGRIGLVEDPIFTE